MPNIKSAKDRYATAVKNGSEGGRPRKNIDIEQILELQRQGKTQAEIGEIIGVSKNTIANRLREHKNQKPEIKTNNNLDIDSDKDKDIYVDSDRDNRTNKPKINSKLDF